ncbi:MAG: CBS domain-containing protein [Proteobacteria bacterium]|nr:CBS domain-containing protein [Pseudomonadota bacterium]
MNVGQISGGRLVTVSQHSMVSEVARMMAANHVGAVIVTENADDESPMVGLITDRDIVNAQLDQTKDLNSLSAEAVMTRKVLTLSPGDSLDGAIAHMRARNVRRAPIVSAGGVPVGMVSTDDLIAQMSFKLCSIAGIVAKQSQRER